MIYGAVDIHDEYLIHIIKNCDAFDENKVYIFGDDAFTEMVFGEHYYENVQLKYFINQFRWKEYSDLQNLIQKTWKLVEFKNYHSKYFIENLNEDTLLNINNDFVMLLIKNRDLFQNRDKQMILEAFFRTLKMNLRRSGFNKIVNQQNEILNVLVNEKRIKEREKYILKPSDFPPIFKESY